MELSADLFERIAGEMGGQTPQADDRRRRPRIGRCAGAVIYPCRNGVIDVAMPVGVGDVSATGICILQYRLLENGQKFILELKTRDEQVVRILCQVKYSRPVNEDLFAMGAEFVALWFGAVHPGTVGEAA